MSDKSIEKISPLYREQLSKVLSACFHEGILEPTPYINISSSLQGLALMAHVDPSQHTIIKASFQADGSDLFRGLLEVLCRIMEGKPVQECSEHAVIYLEFELRDLSQKKSVPGILIPENADPCFSVLIRLVRDLFRKYQTATCYQLRSNFYYSSPSQEWRSLTVTQRIKKLEETLRIFCQTQGLSQDSVQLISCDHLVRITVGFPGDHSSQEKQTILLRLERDLKDKLEKTIELYTEELKDKNVLRRLGKPSNSLKAEGERRS